MTGRFACPECGLGVSPRMSTAGLRVRCESCGTLVEVPFLPRAKAKGHGRGSRRRAEGWLWASIGVVAAIVMVVGAVAIARGRGLAAREAEVASAVAVSEKAEAEGRFDDALAAGESALKIARKLPPESRKPIRQRRDHLAVRQAEAQLTAVVDHPDPVSALRSLLVLVEADPAREPVRSRVLNALADALAKQAETDLSAAARAVATGHPDQALALCEGVAGIADELGFERSGGVRDAARTIARGVIDRYGVNFAPVKGEFLQGPGTAQVHAASLFPIVAEALRRRGYFPRPAKSAFLAEWDEHAPYQVAVEVIERNDGSFFQTPLHTARLNAYVALTKGPTLLWQTRPQGKTRVPPPNMTAFEMSHLSLKKDRDPAIEKRLYDDARIVLAENLANSLRSLPSP